MRARWRWWAAENKRMRMKVKTMVSNFFPGRLYLSAKSMSFSYWCCTRQGRAYERFKFKQRVQVHTWKKLVAYS